jgi:hypothetical protein
VRRTLVGMVVGIALVGVLAVPSLADVDQSPNAVELINVTCPPAGLSFGTIWLPSRSTLAGHDLEDNIVGVVKSLFITDQDGNPIAQLFHRPGKGLDNITVWCFWPDADSPTGFVGGDILFRGPLRG